MGPSSWPRVALLLFLTPQKEQICHTVISTRIVARTKSPTALAYSAQNSIYNLYLITRTLSKTGGTRIYLAKILLEATTSASYVVHKL
ncbi:uncharacterized protein F5147DRAFT_404898 [Suillus discolor]|uniref:Uncharacterized protein n=1 Tax=Suillus discolor TaxID=1912936 RepID=A0A9P7EWR4_9AGAM|nr:uncharacterized protein F5147DRAFT_404898 [Suillus discolor]KAG2095147.1 hypothetical protein F5147DRAFT_404898 [Suillus discolor]